MAGMVIIRGPLGIGKTTISKKLARRLRGRYTSIDRVVDSKAVQREKATDGFISEESFIRANTLIIPKIKTSLAEKKWVVVDGNFYRKKALLDLLARVKCQSIVFTLTAPLSVCIKRDKNRAKPLGLGAATVVYNQTMKFKYGTVVDVATLDVDDSVEFILNRIKSVFSRK